MATRTKRTRLLAALLCALLVALMLPALPTVGYAASDTVVYLSNSGDDANDGSTQALAVKTLDRALALADGHLHPETLYSHRGQPADHQCG